MKLNCLEKGYYFDNIVFQLNWKNPEIWDRMGKFMAIFDEILEFKELSGEEGLKLYFHFKRYPEIIGTIQRSRLWFQMKKLDANYNLELFKDQTLNVITKTIENCPPLYIGSFGIRIATILDSKQITHLQKKFFKLVPFEFSSKAGDLFNLKLQWTYKSNNYRNKFKASQNVLVFYGEKTSKIERPELPDDGVILDVDTIIYFERTDQYDKVRSWLKENISDVIGKYDAIASELVALISSVLYFIFDLLKKIL
ncbi:hypothetical protein [Thermosipho sp. 1074]|uniref:hypothetical protein n=1 Tax=Thermosipho sp. 1074 TaxID=1643331 RepID=UPI000987917E|nr:hypothetical protein [Thermosipho sp. 1074]OOC42165.1 hypothetical protein XO08_07725 [Thermosipho sp. 1074]